MAKNLQGPITWSKFDSPFSITLDTSSSIRPRAIALLLQSLSKTRFDRNFLPQNFSYGFRRGDVPRLCVILLVLITLFAFSGGREIKIKQSDDNHIYNHTLARTLVEYASAVYITDLTALYTWTCSRCNDRIKGFRMIELIVDVQNCLQAFVGFSHDLNSIIVAFRGTQKSSIRNWIEDLYWKQLDLHYPGMPEAMVHCGFYSAYHNTTLRPEIINAVQSAMKLHGDVRIIVTGHSMGGALAAFCALDLTVNYGIQDIQVMTFGQPRVGNAAFASYFHKKVPQAVRVTNGNDIVPHLPPYYSYFPEKTYHHFPREVWLHEVGIGSLSHLVEEICDGSGRTTLVAGLYTVTVYQTISIILALSYVLMPGVHASL
uniref:Fungal lipase-type domain-containing protein n=1 Tax=Ananas comosus var. bracteatus TaxID=296719 RepID=A0A6V7NTJ9_ANACO|nr:unnamed protein product [Ananas comosus var. bracteatus]